MSNISHLCINCAPADFEQVLTFYLAALKPMGYREMMRPVEQVVGLGSGMVPDFWISAEEDCGKISIGQRRKMGIHFAFAGKIRHDRQPWMAANTEIDRCPVRLGLLMNSANLQDLMAALIDHSITHAFHAAALKAGGICNGKPGYRPQYFKYYYAAFVHHPLGNNVEVVCVYPAWTQWWWWRSWLPSFKGLDDAESKTN